MQRSTRYGVITFFFMAVFAGVFGLAAAEPGDKPKENPPAKDQSTSKGQATQPASLGDSSSTGSHTAAAESGSKPHFPPFSEVLKDTHSIDGLVKLHRKEDKLFAELGSNLLDHDFIVLISIARGIGENPILGGMSWGFGDDWLWQFRKVDDKIQVVRRNVRFTAAKGSPEERAVHLAYTDSVLFSLPIVTIGPGGGYVIDLAGIFMTDLPQFSNFLPGFNFARDKSNWASVKGFRDNVEIEVAATYSSGGAAKFDTVPDSRGLTVNVHYSISLLPQTGYQSRLADDRVGYFLTAVKDFSKRSDRDRFIRYINRWNLQKADSLADLSRPSGRLSSGSRKRSRSSTANRSAKGSWNGTRHLRRPGSPTPSRSASSRTMPIGIRKTSTTTPSAGSRPGRRSPWGRRG